MRVCYFSKCYKELYSAGSKAKTDMEQIMCDLGYRNIGFPCLCLLYTSDAADE